MTVISQQDNHYITTIKSPTHTPKYHPTPTQSNPDSLNLNTSNTRTTSQTLTIQTKVKIIISEVGQTIIVRDDDLFIKLMQYFLTYFFIFYINLLLYYIFCFVFFFFFMYSGDWRMDIFLFLRVFDGICGILEEGYWDRLHIQMVFNNNNIFISYFSVRICPTHFYSNTSSSETQVHPLLCRCWQILLTSSIHRQTLSR